MIYSEVLYPTFPVCSDDEEVSQQPFNPSPGEFTSTPGPSLAKRTKMPEDVPPRLLSPSPTECTTTAKQKKV